MITHSPSDVGEVVDIVADAARGNTTLGIVGGGTRAGLGRAVSADASLSVSKLTGITLYEPAELVISARAGTPIKEIRAALAPQRQMMPFEPMDHRQLYDSEGEPTVGGLFSTNASGPRRVVAGSARDHILGIQLINGRAEAIRAGGRVMKNVTGLDLPKLATGAMGTLGVLTEITFKVLPRPEHTATVVLSVEDPATAIGFMTKAMGSPYDVSGAAFCREVQEVLLRIEGFRDSVSYRIEALSRMFGPVKTVLQGSASECVWHGVGDISALGALHDDEIWRVSVAPSKAVQVLEVLPKGCRLLFDWSGGLIWIACGISRLDEVLRSALASLGGHATLMRASAERRVSAQVFQPPSPAVMRISAAIKQSFDPKGIFNPGRMYEGV